MEICRAQASRGGGKERKYEEELKLPSKAKTQRVPYQQLRNWQIERASERVSEGLRAVAAAAPSNTNGEKKGG